MKELSKYLISVNATFVNGEIVPEIPYEEIMRLVNEPKIVIVKSGIPEHLLKNVIESTWSWSQRVPASEVPDTFDNNQHKRRLHIARIQQAPQLFHDHTFDAIKDLEGSFKETLLTVFDPLRTFWNNLTGNKEEYGIRKGQPYFHPQVTHYPLGGSFFGRHWHPLNPQKVGTILALNKYGRDYHSGGTGYIINDTVIETEGFQDVGDIILFRYDLPHWVSPSSFADRFNWNDPAGRWVAILPFYDPWGQPAEHDEPQGWKQHINASNELNTVAV
ncbi:hypothetical protein [Arsenicibacter rosenii]|uniref:Prolyl 4-hydroxylase alpha subunit Fe(2+) 2OG dioxygenase domain-containing protein n=1 Tax=Arsenicibacter rosenii TaxID=1750698 RepID=A0A1S2VCK5_9BACT|nr:hypothetical protein [Arsenicibacter rosenii]OIN56422.1 hypothetical protein BLX24_24940 [Arsenicibacter rosenii]